MAIGGERRQSQLAVAEEVPGRHARDVAGRRELSGVVEVVPSPPM
jgi:hypothetical protein